MLAHHGTMARTSRIFAAMMQAMISKAMPIDADVLRPDCEHVRLSAKTGGHMANNHGKYVIYESWHKLAG